MIPIKTDATARHQQALRGAVFSSLSNILSEQDTITAIRSWDIYSENNNSLFNGVNSFARELCIDIQQPEKQRDVVKAINRALIFGNSKSNQNTPITRPNIEKLSVRPSVKKTTALEPELKSAVIFSPEFETFKILLAELLLRIELQSKQYRETALIYLEELIHSMPWSAIQQQQIQDAMNLKDVYQTRQYSTGQLKSFLNHFRSWITDEFGQKLGNEILQESWDVAAVTDQGVRYPPKQLL